MWGAKRNLADYEVIAGKLNSSDNEVRGAERNAFDYEV